jgi:glutamyl-tRNA reductase
MAIRLGRLERDLTELDELAARRQTPAVAPPSPTGRGRLVSSEVLLLGVSHKTAPVALRERLALLDTQVAAFLRDLSATPSIREAVVIQTCNRTELYLVVSDPVEAETAALGALSARAGIRPTELAEIVYAPRNCDAARQLFRVTSGSSR